MRLERANASLEAMAADPGSIDRARVAREFEALLLAQVWKGASRSLGVSKLLDSGSAGRMYRELLIDEVVRRAALARGLGLAGAVAAQLSSQAESAVAPEASRPGSAEPREGGTGG